MTSAGELFDGRPKQCPGCGGIDAPSAEGGPSRLMLIWAWRLCTYLCHNCNSSYTSWLGTNWTIVLDKNGDPVDQAETHKPKCLKNIEAIQRGAEPDYKGWIPTSPT